MRGAVEELLQKNVMVEVPGTILHAGSLRAHRARVFVNMLSRLPQCLGPCTRRIDPNARAWPLPGHPIAVGKLPQQLRIHEGYSTRRGTL